MIPRTKIDEIVDAARVEEVVGEYVNLKKRGVNLTGLCPFHQEKSPSFSVSPIKGIYKCFGCGKAGNSVNFIMDIEQLNYIDALKHLAEKYRIEWPQKEVSPDQLIEEKLRTNERESLQIVNNFAERYFADLLFNDEEGRTVGLSYFDERGFRPETIEKFKLGYAKESWDHLTNAAKEGGYNLDLLKLSGLIKENDQGRVYDAYRNRVIFPIHSISGKPIAFAGRYLVKDPKSPKYVNSPETPLYHKSNELYGLFFAKQAISKNSLVYLVEGYTDVISLHQAGIENVVASSGTSLTEGQIKLIKRFTDNVCVLYDGDAAGIKASLRGTDMLLEAGLNVKIVLFPNGEDPDSYCRRVGPMAFSAFLEENKQDFILFKTNLLLNDAGNDPVKRAELIKDIVSTISKIPDAFKRSTFLRETSILLKVDEQLLISEANKLIRINTQRQSPFVDLEPMQTLSEQEMLIESVQDLHQQDVQEKDLIRVLLSYGDKPYNEDYASVALFILHEITNDEIEVQQPIVASILNEVHNQITNEVLSLNYFLRHEDPLVTAFVADTMSKDFEVSPNWQKKYDVFIDPVGYNFKEDVESALLRLKIKHVEKLMKHNQEELEKFELAKDNEQVEIHVQVHMHLTKKRHELTRKIETTITR
jgi:DNA primase